MTIRIGNGAGFWGDDLDAPRRLLTGSQLDYLTLEYLAELTMSILANQRAKDPQAGFATDFLTVMNDIIPFLKESGVRIITNAGGIHPQGCAAAVAKKLADAGLGEIQVAVVSGDDLLPHLVDLQNAGCEFRNLDSGGPLSDLTTQPACANAYLGAKPIADALTQDARIVITGRVADASLAVGPLVHEFGWGWDDWDRLAAATVAGHLIECGAQATGGYSARWRELDFVDIGYPIAEVEPSGSAIITKPSGSGGIVDRRSVVEQLVYEIGDPQAYLTPDVIADFTSVEVAEEAPNRVRVQGAIGRPATDSYKVSLAYPAGYTASAMLLVCGEDVAEKARFAGELVLKRLQKRGLEFDRSNIECLGGGDGVPIPDRNAGSTNETVLRITVHDRRRSAVERFTQEIAPLITNGPNGLAGYASGRPTVRPVLAYWPTLVPKNLVSPKVEVKAAAEWAR